MNDKKLVIGIAGVCLVIIGTIAPLLNFSIHGVNDSVNISYLGMSNLELLPIGRNDGIFVLCTAIIAGIIVYFRIYQALFITGVVSIGSMISTYIAIKNQLIKLGASGDIAESFIHIQWGCFFLVLGSLMMVICAYMTRTKESINY